MIHLVIPGLLFIPVLVSEEIIIFRRMVVLELFHGHFSGDPHPVHGEYFGTQVFVVEVEYEDEHDGQQRFVAVHHRDRVPYPRQRPGGKEPGNGNRKGEEESGCADEEHAPEHGEVIELLHIAEFAEIRRFFSHAEEIHEILDYVYNVPWHRDDSDPEVFLSAPG